MSEWFHTTHTFIPLHTEEEEKERQREKMHEKKCLTKIEKYIKEAEKRQWLIKRKLPEDE